MWTVIIVQLGDKIIQYAMIFYVQIQPANVVVEKMISQIISQEVGYQYFKVDEG